VSVDGFGFFGFFGSGGFPDNSGPAPEKCARLLSLGMDNVTLGVIPFGTELPLAPYNSFLLLDDDLSVETLAGKDEERAEDAAELYHRIFDLLMAEARTGDSARRLIATAADRLRVTT